jgi:hypothetical protein
VRRIAPMIRLTSSVNAAHCQLFKLASVRCFAPRFFGYIQNDKVGKHWYTIDRGIHIVEKKNPQTIPCIASSPLVGAPRIGCKIYETKKSSVSKLTAPLLKGHECGATHLNSSACSRPQGARASATPRAE